LWGLFIKVPTGGGALKRLQRVAKCHASMAFAPSKNALLHRCRKTTSHLHSTSFVHFFPRTRPKKRNSAGPSTFFKKMQIVSDQNWRSSQSFLQLRPIWIAQYGNEKFARTSPQKSRVDTGV